LCRPDGREYKCICLPGRIVNRVLQTISSLSTWPRLRELHGDGRCLVLRPKNDQKVDKPLTAHQAASLRRRVYDLMGKSDRVPEWASACQSVSVKVHPAENGCSCRGCGGSRGCHQNGPPMFLGLMSKAPSSDIKVLTRVRHEREAYPSLSPWCLDDRPNIERV